MHQISIDASPHQLRKLKRGHKVRIKKGSGFNLIVYPETYNIVQRAFAKNKGVELSLSPEELDHNAEALSGANGPSPEQHKSDNLLLGNNDEGDEEQEVGLKGSGVAKHVAHSLLTQQLNKQLGTNYGYMSRAGLDNAIANKANSKLAKLGIDARIRTAPMAGMHGGELPPRSRMGGGGLERSSVSQKGRLISSYCPPAFMSQPFSANWQMQFFLPPQYQKFNQGGHSQSRGSGLYV